MGLAHPLLIVGMVGGERRPLAAVDLAFADPDKDMLHRTYSQVFFRLRSEDK